MPNIAKLAQVQKSTCNYGEQLNDPLIKFSVLLISSPGLFQVSCAVVPHQDQPVRSSPMQRIPSTASW
jgi:hypothetical protein